jgi:hypothetical protein
MRAVDSDKGHQRWTAGTAFLSRMLTPMLATPMNMEAKWKTRPGTWPVNDAPGLATATPMVMAQTTPAARNSPPTTFNRVDIFVSSFDL